MITGFHHLNITTPESLEAATKHFYGSILGLQEVPKPEASRNRGGAWYEIENVQIHLSREQGVSNAVSKRHFCLLVNDMECFENKLRAAEIEILPEERPIPGTKRFYIRDPAGNLIEIAETR